MLQAAGQMWSGTDKEEAGVDTWLATAWHPLSTVALVVIPTHGCGKRSTPPTFNNDGVVLCELDNS